MKFEVVKHKYAGLFFKPLDDEARESVRKAYSHEKPIGSIDLDELPGIKEGSIVTIDSPVPEAT